MHKDTLTRCLFHLLLLKESQDGATLESAHFELPRDKCLVVVHSYTAMPSRYHGDENHDPLTDLSEGGGDDVEHPSLITMDAPSPPQARRGHMARAHTRSIETEVNSFLFDFHSDSHVSWILPQAEMLRMIRYQGVDHGEASTKTRAPTDEKRRTRR